MKMPPREPVVIILSVEEFALLQERATAAQREPYLYARELLLRSMRADHRPPGDDAVAS